MSDIWLRKMRTYFHRIDFDRDGAITRKDFTDMADRFAQKATGSGADVLRKRITAVYDEYLGKATQGKPVNLDTFIGVMKEEIGKEAMKDKLTGPLPLLFRAVDNNDDGMISKDEFTLFYEIIGIDRNDAAPSFQAIDENSDGQLSLDEFIHSGLDFFTNQEDSVNKIFWGPLVD